MSPESCAPVSGGFPIQLHMESPAGVWVPPPSKGAPQSKPPMEAMLRARTTLGMVHIVERIFDDGPVLLTEMARSRRSPMLR
jgi:hypothetical protein